MIDNSADVWCTGFVFRCHFPGGGHLDTAVEFVYRASDPAVFAVTFPDAAKPCSWVFGRDLLRDGLLSGTESEPVGLGDVKVWTGAWAGDGQAWISLDTPAGFIEMSTAERPFTEFVFGTYEFVSEAEQWRVEVDNLLASVLG